MQVLSDERGKTCESGDRDPAAAAESREGAGRVLAVLTRLPENQQDVICLRFQGGLSYKEIAAVTGLTVSNVGYLIHTAVKTIHEMLKVKTRSVPQQ